jgi:hypothetical protein
LLLTRRQSPLAALAAAALALAACGGPGSSGGGEQPKAGGTPPEGEYSYTSRGFERLSAAVAAQNNYPRRSTVTVTPGACGFSERWEPRPERSSEWRFCVDGSRWRVALLIDYHEFFGQPVVQRFTCRGPLVPRPPTVPLDFTWTDRCRGAGSRVTVRYRAVKEQPQIVSGKPVRAVLVRARAELRGRINGVNRLDSWLSRENGLLLRRKVRSDTTIGSPFGTVKDRERYALQIRSLAPG